MSSWTCARYVAANFCSLTCSTFLMTAASVSADLGDEVTVSLSFMTHLYVASLPRIPCMRRPTDIRFLAHLHARVRVDATLPIHWSEERDAPTKGDGRQPHFLDVVPFRLSEGVPASKWIAAQCAPDGHDAPRRAVFNDFPVLDPIRDPRQLVQHVLVVMPICIEVCAPRERLPHPLRDDSTWCDRAAGSVVQPYPCFEVAPEVVRYDSRVPEVPSPEFVHDVLMRTRPVLEDPAMVSVDAAIYEADGRFREREKLVADRANSLIECIPRMPIGSDERDVQFLSGTWRTRVNEVAREKDAESVPSAPLEPLLDSLHIGVVRLHRVVLEVAHEGNADLFLPWNEP